MLYRSTDRLRRAGAPVKNLAHVPSLSKARESVPSYSGTEHLDSPRPLVTVGHAAGHIVKPGTNLREWISRMVGFRSQDALVFSAKHRRYSAVAAPAIVSTPTARMPRLPSAPFGSYAACARD